MTVPHTLQEQLTAALAKAEAMEVDLHTERVGRLLAERRLLESRQGGPRYARNLPEWPRNEHKRGFE